MTSRERKLRASNIFLMVKVTAIRKVLSHKSHSGSFLSITSGAFNKKLQSDNDVLGYKRRKGAINLELLNPGRRANENIDPKVTNKPFAIITSKAPSNYFWLLFALASSALNSHAFSGRASKTKGGKEISPLQDIASGVISCNNNVHEQ